jgi:hypothetical protein
MNEKKFKKNIKTVIENLEKSELDHWKGYVECLRDVLNYMEEHSDDENEPEEKEKLEEKNPYYLLI